MICFEVHSIFLLLFSIAAGMVLQRTPVSVAAPPVCQKNKGSANDTPKVSGEFSIDGTNLFVRSLGITEEGKLLLLDYNSSRLLEVSLDAAEPRTRWHKEPEPGGLVTLSPDGKHLLWTNYHYMDTPPGPSLFPKERVGKATAIPMWMVFYVSATDGTKVRYVGHYPMHKEPEDAKRYGDAMPAVWLPDGKRASFTRSGKVYVFSTEL